MTDTDTMLDILVLTRTILSHPVHWTKGTHWRDRHGFNCEMVDAVSFCLVGALHYAICQLGMPVCHLKTILDRLRMATKDREPIASLILWNDNLCTTHPDVLALLDREITALMIRTEDTQATHTQNTRHAYV